MRKFRVSLWLFGICAIRSDPATAEVVDKRSENWRRVFGEESDIRVEEVYLG